VTIIARKVAPVKVLDTRQFMALPPSLPFRQQHRTARIADQAKGSRVAGNFKKVLKDTPAGTETKSAVS